MSDEEWGMIIESGISLPAEEIPLFLQGIADLRAGNTKPIEYIRKELENSMTNPVKPLPITQTALAEAKAAKEGYLRKLPVAVDIFASELAGNPMGMTISTSWGLLALGVDPRDASKRVGKLKQGLGALGCKFLNLFQKNHDAMAAAGDDERAKHLRQLLHLSGIIS